MQTHVTDGKSRDRGWRGPNRASSWAELRGRGGFTLMELMIVGAMTSLLAVLFSLAWSGLGQPSADALVRCQIAQEARLATASLAADLGGSLPGQETGSQALGNA